MFEGIRRYKIEILVTVALIVAGTISACASEAPATAVVMPEMLATEATTVEMDDLMPSTELGNVEGDPGVLEIQEDCIDYTQEDQADLCMGLIRVGDQYVWVGRLGSDYNPGTVFKVVGYRADGTLVPLFEGTSGHLNEFSVVTHDGLENNIVTLSAKIGGVKGEAFFTNEVTPENNHGTRLMLFTVPEEQKYKEQNEGEKNT